MPFYDLKCGSCGYEYEEMLPLADAPIEGEDAIGCPKCSRVKVRVHVKTAPAFHARYSPAHPRKNRGRGY